MNNLAQMRAKMNSFWKINLVMLMSSIAGLSSCKLKAPKQDSQVNVLGGQAAPAGKFPFVVQIVLSPTIPEICSGVIIGPRTVIAAAHCIKNDGVDLYNKPFVEYQDQNQRTISLKATQVYAFSKVINAKVIYENEVGLDFVILDFDPGAQRSKGPFSHLTSYPRLRAAEEGLSVSIVGFGATELGKPGGKLKSFGYNTIHKVDGAVGSIKIVGDEKVDLYHALATKGDSGGPLLNRDGTDIIGISSALKTDPVTKVITNYFVDLNSEAVQTLLGYYKLSLEKSGYGFAENEFLVDIASKKLDELLKLEDKIAANGLWPYSSAPEKLEPTCLLLKLLMLKNWLTQNNGKGNVGVGVTNGSVPNGAIAESQGSIQVTKNWPFGGSVNVSSAPKASLALVQQENGSPVPASGPYSYFQKSRQPANEMQFNKFVSSHSRHVSIPVASMDLTANFMQPSAP